MCFWKVTQSSLHIPVMFWYSYTVNTTSREYSQNWLLNFHKPVKSLVKISIVTLLNFLQYFIVYLSSNLQPHRNCKSASTHGHKNLCSSPLNFHRIIPFSILTNEKHYSAPLHIYAHAALCCVAELVLELYDTTSCKCIYAMIWFTLCVLCCLLYTSRCV